jgi:deoxyribonuclease-1
MFADHNADFQALQIQAAKYSCTPRKKCGEMESCEEAYFHLEECGNKRLDRDNDGIPCESICQ